MLGLSLMKLYTIYYQDIGLTLQHVFQSPREHIHEGDKTAI